MDGVCFELQTGKFTVLTKKHEKYIRDMGIYVIQDIKKQDSPIISNR